jgi:hypothetical protein
LTLLLQCIANEFHLRVVSSKNTTATYSKVDRAIE